MQKSTHKNKIELFQTLIKTEDSKYIAILSDDSVDRDNEIIGYPALSKVAAEDSTEPIVILVDHKNTMDNYIGEWVNRRMEVIDGHNAFVAEPKFYDSNPKAKMIKGMRKW